MVIRDQKVSTATLVMQTADEVKDQRKVSLAILHLHTPHSQIQMVTR